MHPINNNNFGAGKIKVFFHDGTALTSGYVVKQVGTSRYVITDGTTTKTATLAPTVALAKRLDGSAALGNVSDLAGLCTMTVTVSGTVRHITKLTASVATTPAGAFPWTLTTPSATVFAVTAHVVTAIANTVAPTISGTAKVGQVLTAATGTWTGSPASFAYVWKAGGTAIANATASTYTPVAGDVGKTITVTVTGSEAGTAAVSATSAATSAVAA